MVRAQSAKHWCFTINNPTEQDEKDMQQLVASKTAYFVAGDEKGADGTPHVQGYLVLKEKLRLTALKKLLPRAHLEMSRGTPKQASDYCKKDGRFLEYGELPLSPAEAGGAGTAALWKETWDLAKTGDFESLDPKIRIQHYHALRRIHQDYQQRPPDLADVCGVWYYGPPRTGKSTAARALPGTYYDKPCNKWFDGYQGEDNVLIDDFDLSHKALGHHLKRWADKFAFPAEQKGTTVQIRPKLIVVTSNYSIEEIFADDPVLVAALKRRFKCTHYDTFFQ